MKVVIAEKPSVAQTIGKVLGATYRKDGYIEGNGYRITWNLGHLFRLYNPEDYNVDFKKWSLETLPIIPSMFKYAINNDSGYKKQFGIIKQLFNDSSTTEIINAGDAGREGELIFRLTYIMSSSKKPVKRLWLSSMEEIAIKKGFQDLQASQKYDNLYYSALARQHADWLIGINGTRYFSLKSNDKSVIKKMGRVQTPTLNMIVNRENEIHSFKVENYFKVVAVFINPVNNERYYAYSDRIDEDKIANRLKEQIDKKASLFVVENVSDEEKRATPPHLYDLTSLQKDASKYFGLTADQTLTSAQNLYEQKLSTYPRTDSKYLTDDMEQTAYDILRKCETVFKDIHKKQNPNPNIKAHLNSSKVSDHYAIIPTSNLSLDKYNSLNDQDKKVYGLIIERVIEAFDDNYIYRNKKIDYRFLGVHFLSKGKTEIKLGWKEKMDNFKLFQKADEEPREKNDDREDQILPNHKIGDKVQAIKGIIKPCKTVPPQHYTESTILSAMETAGAKETSKNAERKGLGTPATRAEILKKLVSDGYVVRKNKSLLPTEIGYKLIEVIPERYKSPLLTAEWENKLVLINEGKYSYKQFIIEVENETKMLIGK